MKIENIGRLRLELWSFVHNANPALEALPSVKNLEEHSKEWFSQYGDLDIDDYILAGYRSCGWPSVSVIIFLLKNSRVIVAYERDGKTEKRIEYADLQSCWDKREDILKHLIPA